MKTWTLYLASILALLLGTTVKAIPWHTTLSLGGRHSGSNHQIVVPFSRQSRPLFPSTDFHRLIVCTNGGAGAKSPNSGFKYTKVDWVALIKYPVGLAGQMALIFGFLKGIDRLVGQFSLNIPFALNAVFLYAFNLKSSLFSLFPNKASEWLKVQQTKWEYNQRKKPTWTPPGIAFVLGWPLLTFGLRAITGAMVVQASAGRYATGAIMSLMLHLGVADLWNTASNVERRLGVSVVFIYDLWITKAFAAYQFYKVDPLAGKLLAISLTWITAACALSTRTWQINPDSDTGKPEPLIPMQHPKWSTEFRWERPTLVVEDTGRLS